MKTSLNRKPTANDVARLAGVSQPAVSRAFTEGASISPAMRERVMMAAKALGYRPNAIARSLTQNRSNVVGLVLGHIDNPFFALALNKLAAALDDVGYQMLLFTAEANATVDKQVEQMLSHQVSAVILLAVNLSSSLTDECKAAGIPVILFNRTIADDQATFAVTGDNVGGAAAIAEHFLDRGKSKIAFMAGYEDSSTSQSREAAFQAYLIQKGLPPARRVVGHYSRAGAAAAARTLFSNAPDRPDALFCANDLMAITTIETLREEFGLEPGRDYALAGFDDIPMASWPSFMLTTYSQPVDAMVSAAVACVRALDDSVIPQRRIILEGQLIIRKTT